MLELTFKIDSLGILTKYGDLKRINEGVSCFGRRKVLSVKSNTKENNMRSGIYVC